MRHGWVCALGALVALGCESAAPTSGGTDGEPPECVPLTPEILLVAEASERMQAPMPGAEDLTRWKWLVDALQAELPHVKGDADLALLAFPSEGSPGGSGPTLDAAPLAAHCAVSPPQLPFGRPFGQLVSTLGKVVPAGGAPIAAALRSAADTFAARSPSGRSRHVVLMVTGEDTCGGDVQSEILALKGLGVDVWVATVGDPSSGALRRWAIAGGHPSGGGAWKLTSRTVVRELQAAVAASATAETCDGFDNDCDGVVDEGLTRACLDECGGGEQSCVAGSWRACGATGSDAAEELCDGVDNDCDGEVDEGFGTGEACSDEVGPCVFDGSLACSSDGTSAVCDTGEQWPGPEVCDGLDNDCDGQVDDGADAPCTDGCRDGVRSCVDGVLGACVLGDLLPELCDGEDNDCDGEVDEGFDVGATCVIASGGCIAMGVMVCTADGSSVCGSTSPTSPAPEQCNGVDDDCDGVVDNGVALCPGKQVCYAGQCIYD
ncbi:MAG: hypothetical protein AMXMBFR64_23510 [Myxococcales bacterium]